MCRLQFLRRWPGNNTNIYRRVADVSEELPVKGAATKPSVEVEWQTPEAITADTVFAGRVCHKVSWLNVKAYVTCNNKCCWVSITTFSWNENF